MFAFRFDIRKSRARRLGIGLILAILAAGCTERPAPTPSADVAMPSFAPVVNRVLPAVVNVSALTEAGAAEENGATSAFDDLLHRLFGLTPPHTARIGLSLGSGFIIDPAGYIVTGNHVVAGATEITVALHDNTKLHARIVGRDTLTDLALLAVDAGHTLPAVSWGDSEAVQVGDWVVAVGNPFGLGGTVSSGILSARGRNLGSGPYDDFLQIDAAINRGNSGGPTFDLAGQVIGVTTAIYSPSGGSVGIAFAVPSRLARPVIDRLRADGKIRRGWLGAQVQEMTPDLARSLGLNQADGVLIADIDPAGPAGRAGLQAGDVLLSFDGQPIHASRELARRVAETPPGRPVPLQLWRDRRAVDISVTVEELADAAATTPTAPAAPPKAEPSDTALGLSLLPLTAEARALFDLPPKLAGALVMSIAEDSPFQRLDIAPGDAVVSVDRHPVVTVRQALAALREAAQRHSDPVLIQLNRAGAGHFIALPATAPR